MSEPNFSQILIIGPPGRKRDNLLTLLESLVASSSIQSVDTCQQADEIIKPNLSTLVLVDYRDTGKEMKTEINSLVMNNPNIHIVLLRSRTAQKDYFTNQKICEAIYDDISIEVLHNFIFALEKKDNPLY